MLQVKLVRSRVKVEIIVLQKIQHQQNKEENKMDLDDMSQEELDIYSDMNNPNNDSYLDND
jgi:hypothetical protein